MFVYLYTTNAVMPHPQHRTGKTVLGEYYWGGGPSYDPSTDPFYRPGSGQIPMTLEPFYIV